ncbi:Protein LHY, partial [Mucuna pruriens]
LDLTQFQKLDQEVKWWNNQIQYCDGAYLLGKLILQTQKGGWNTSTTMLYPFITNRIELLVKAMTSSSKDVHPSNSKYVLLSVGACVNSVKLLTESKSKERHPKAVLNSTPIVINATIHRWSQWDSLCNIGRVRKVSLESLQLINGVAQLVAVRTLEKEALVKGVPIGQALDIDIPPPRPKRKPNNPYPRKTRIGTATLHSGAKDAKFNLVESSHVNQALDLEKEPLPEKHDLDEGPTTVKENKDENRSNVFTPLQEVPCSSVSSANKSSITMSVPLGNSCALKEITPSVKEVIAQDEKTESFVTIELENGKLDIIGGRQTNGTSRDSTFENSDALQIKLVQNEKTDSLDSALTIDGMPGNQNYPRHVTVHVVDGNLGTSAKNPSQDMLFRDSIFQPIGGVNGQPNLFTNSAASNTSESQNNTARSSVHQSFLPYPPFTQHNQDDYQSFLHMSSTFSNLVVSTLLQNPAAHAAASFGATFWPYANPETSADSPRCSQGSFTCRQIGSPPSVAAIAGATVAAATAWWAAHGLLPLCAPLHTAFGCPPASVTAVPSMNTGEASALKAQQEKTIQNPPLQDQMLDPAYSEAQQAQNPASKSPAVIPSDSESGDAKLNTSSKATDHETNQTISEHLDSSKTKGRKQVDRSSCGSNTASSSDVETDALEKDEKGKEEPETPDANHLAIESSNRRRSVSNLTDSWKEVSEEGRLAFQALFSREVLPQSFSPPHALKNKDHQMENTKDNKQNIDDKDENLESKKCSSNYEGMQINLPFVENNQGLLTIGLGQGKLKTRRTGFKPYKRCSMESKENRVGTTSNQGEEKCCKRIRLEGETST